MCYPKAEPCPPARKRKEDAFHTLDRDVSKSWEVRDGSIKIKIKINNLFLEVRTVPIV